MKILVVTSFYPPLGSSGHDARCQQVAEALSKQGHRLQVLTSNYRVPPGGVASDKGVFRELILSAVMSDEELRQLSYQDVLAIELENAAIVDYRIERFKPDLVLVWGCSQLSKSLFKRLQDRGLRVAFDLHTNWLQPDVFDMDPWQWWWKQQHSLSARVKKLLMTISGGRRRTQRLLPVYTGSELSFSNAWFASADLKESLMRNGVVGIESVPVVHSALNLSEVTPKRVYTHNGRFMWAGRLSTDKAPELALEAFAQLKDAGEQVSLDIFGMGEPIERKEMRERINEMGLSDSVEMVAIRPGELSEHYANYDALLFTSRCDDPLPMTPVEAMLSGLPCLISRDGGIQEIVKDGETALLYERDDVGAMVQSIQRFLELPDAGASIAKECRQRLMDQHSMEIYVEKVLGLVHQGREV
ncbi:MAG TPA: hypothetical protein DCX06_04870 [Opitutae bacterium]|nr:hypothetical protein [Opitutae bacterium]